MPPNKKKPRYLPFSLFFPCRACISIQQYANCFSSHPTFTAVCHRPPRGLLLPLPLILLASPRYDPLLPLLSLLAALLTSSLRHLRSRRQRRVLLFFFLLPHLPQRLPHIFFDAGAIPSQSFFVIFSFDPCFLHTCCPQYRNASRYCIPRCQPATPFSFL